MRKNVLGVRRGPTGAIVPIWGAGAGAALTPFSPAVASRRVVIENNILKNLNEERIEGREREFNRGRISGSGRIPL